MMVERGAWYRVESLRRLRCVRLGNEEVRKRSSGRDQRAVEVRWVRLCGNWKAS